MLVSIPMRPSQRTHPFSFSCSATFATTEFGSRPVFFFAVRLVGAVLAVLRYIFDVRVDRRRSSRVPSRVSSPVLAAVISRGSDARRVPKQSKCPKLESVMGISANLSLVPTVSSACATKVGASLDESWCVYPSSLWFSKHHYSSSCLVF